MDSAWRALDRAGLLPPDCLPAPPMAEYDDLLPFLAGIWSDSAAGGRGAVPAGRRHIAARLQHWHGRGARLTWGVPGAAGSRLDRWIGRRLAWWPEGIPGIRQVGLVSSRLGRDLETRRTWFAALRSACMHLEPHRDLLVAAKSITTLRFVQRAGELFGLPVLEVTVAEGSKRAPRWGWRLLHAEFQRQQPSVFLSPDCDLGSPPPAAPAQTPLADRAVFGLSERLIVLSARPGGNVQRLVERRLAEADFPAASVYLALGAGLVPAELAEPWMKSGAIGWYVQGAADIGGEPPPWLLADGLGSRAAPVRRLPAGDGHWPMLTHWTRRRGGPWPDEPESDYLDDLILERGGADHCAFAALWRIVRARRLIATSDLVRGNLPVVCFTAVALDRWPTLRCFRPHRARWDFEPYGISIDRNWLQRRGARPVRYGDQQLWESLSSDERPFFQKRYASAEGQHPVDWSAEQEWRHPGDVALDELPSNAGLLFVPDLAQARRIARISPWPVLLMEP